MSAAPRSPGTIIVDDDDPDDDFFKKQGTASANPNQACIREGFLKKKSPAGVIRKVWQCRYFKLMPDCMVYSKKKEDKEAQGVIPLSCIGQITRPKGKGEGRFDVEVVGAGVRTFCLLAKNDKEAIEWVETLKNLQKNAVRGSHSPVAPKQESHLDKSALKGIKSPTNSSGNKFWKNKALPSRESRLIAINEMEGEPPPDGEEAAIQLHVLSQDTSFVGFGDLFFAHDRRHRESSYMLHAINKKDKALNSAKLLFKDMKDLKHRFIFNQVHMGETADTIFAMYEPACEKDSSLAHHLRTVKKFPEDVVLTLGAQLTLALEYIHDSSGFGFWTLSPNKLWFASDGSLAIKEPLLCLPASEIPKEMMLPGYRSPEHFQGGEGAVADWWRLGLLMYELLTGTNPFVKPGTTPEAAITKFKVAELKFPEEISKNTQELIKRLMDPNPSSRLGHENDGVDVRGCASWGPVISKSWDTLGGRTPVSPWLKTNILEPAEQKTKQRDTRPVLDKSESVIELTMIGSRGVALEEEDFAGAEVVTQKKTPKKEKKLPPKLLCKIDFEGQYASTTALSAVKSQLEWNERFVFKFRGPLHPTFNIVIQVVDQSKGYGLIVGDISIRLFELKTFGSSAPSWYSILTPDGTANGEVQLSVSLSKVEEKVGSAVSHLPKPLSHYFGSELMGAAGITLEKDEEDELGRVSRESKRDDEEDDGSVPKDDATAMRDAAGNLVHYLSKIRDKRSKDPAKRFKNGGHDLDLTYITPKIIAMSEPSDQSKVGNTSDAVYAFFKQYHPDNLKLYNLGGGKLPADKLAAAGVYDCPIPEHNVPSFPSLVQLVLDAEAHFNAKDTAVLAAHCSTGKGRAGTIIACILLMAGLAETADEALFMFAKKRTPDAIAVTVPSQRRYVHYFEKYLKDYHKLSRPFPMDGKTVTLLRVRLTTLYTLESGGCSPYFVCIGPAPRREVLYDHKKASKEILAEYKSTESHADLICIDESDGSLTGCTLYGDIKFVFFDHDKGSGPDTKLFHFWLNPAFISNDYVCLDRVEIDGAQNKLFKSSFRVELFFAGT